MGPSSQFCKVCIWTIFSIYTEYCIWLDIAYTLGKIYRLCEEVGCDDQLKAYILEVMGPASQKIGAKKEGESANTSLLRGVLLSYLAKVAQNFFLNLSS